MNSFLDSMRCLPTGKLVPTRPPLRVITIENDREAMAYTNNINEVHRISIEIGYKFELPAGCDKSSREWMYTNEEARRGIADYIYGEQVKALYELRIELMEQGHCGNDVFDRIEKIVRSMQ